MMDLTALVLWRCGRDWPSPLERGALGLTASSFPSLPPRLTSHSDTMDTGQSQSPVTPPPGVASVTRLGLKPECSRPARSKMLNCSPDQPRPTDSWAFCGVAPQASGPSSQETPEDGHLQQTDSARYKEHG